MNRFILFACLLGLAVSGTAMAASTSAVPTLKVTTLAGAHYDLATQRGHWVIVNFWATWCRPCIKEMPDISGFVAARKNVSAIGLAYEDSDRADIKAFLNKHPVVYPVAQVDTVHPPADFAQPRGLPTTYVIAPDGKVAKKFVGPVSTSDLAHVVGVAGPG